ncbi:hypothetical protein CH330_01370 [candidate division WOR-3 bacterium JGI_Cruoil_03_51_56]|uniref:Glycosyltransferase 2-like domain-containing protein n=1 Tax=candidate division WOR-3 bacterium JGI_Cruoil_03_51_56 TaxID=1973747 RepID=A0A235BXL6_UNCW3|nr:MAG: hypothetical protein CH330_01370 [candidate division WOR-3 bacterium JGI_Cruoil_03_51_56]
MTKILLVCVARCLPDVAPKLFKALGKIVCYTRQTPEYKKVTIDFTVLTEQPLDGKGKKIPGNQARRTNMNKIRPYAIQHYDYIVKMDSDMIPPPHALVTLIETSVKHEAPVVTSLTPERPHKCGTDAFSQLMTWNGNEGIEKKIPSRIKKLEPFVCTGNAGEAFMLMSREALKKVKWPPYEASGDFAFWDEVHKQKLKVVCTPRVVCAHLDYEAGSQLIRSAKWVLEHWKTVIIKNIEEKRDWFYGLPYDWWHGLQPLKFLEILPFHLLDQKKEPKWFTYRGKQK